MTPQPSLATLFIDTLQSVWPAAENYWLIMLLPLVVGISIVYKGTRIADLRKLPAAAAKMTIQILVVMVLAAAVIYSIHYFAIRYL